MEDLGVRILLFVVMLASGVLLVWSAHAAASGRLKRNQLAGIRVPSTMASDEAWLAAHVRAERPTRLAGFASMASAVFALLPLSTPLLAAGVLLGGLAMLGFVLYGARVGIRAATEVSKSSNG
ncbi:SdpI family protein [Isoptericola rhizosphaerae]|uniref:SdpI family protein n=1 Tax=Isoptericola rhizosphaerae TaxID=3377837 RepID=UPI003839DFFD